MTPADTPADMDDQTPKDAADEGRGANAAEPTPSRPAADQLPAGAADRAPGSWARSRGVSLTMGPLPKAPPKPRMQTSAVPTMAPPTLRRVPEPPAPPPAPPRESSILTGSAIPAPPNPRPWAPSKPTGVVPTAGPVSLDRDLDPTALRALGLGGQTPRPAFKAMPAASPLSAPRDEAPRPAPTSFRAARPAPAPEPERMVRGPAAPIPIAEAPFARDPVVESVRRPAPVAAEARPVVEPESGFMPARPAAVAKRKPAIGPLPLLAGGVVVLAILVLAVGLLLRGDPDAVPTPAIVPAPVSQTAPSSLPPVTAETAPPAPAELRPAQSPAAPAPAPTPATRPPTAKAAPAPKAATPPAPKAAAPAPVVETPPAPIVVAPPLPVPEPPAPKPAAPPPPAAKRPPADPDAPQSTRDPGGR